MKVGGAREYHITCQMRRMRVACCVLDGEYSGHKPLNTCTVHSKYSIDERMYDTEYTAVFPTSTQSGQKLSNPNQPLLYFSGPIGIYDTKCIIFLVEIARNYQCAVLPSLSMVRQSMYSQGQVSQVLSAGRYITTIVCITDAWGCRFTAAVYLGGRSYTSTWYLNGNLI